MAKRRALLARVVALFATITPPIQADDSQGWIADFVWSPHYCSKTLETREAQCRHPNGFVLQTLTRVINGRIAEPCRDGPDLSEAMIDQLARVTRNRAETRLSWQRQGRCSGLSDVDYAAFAEHVDRRMAWPADYQPGGQGLVATADEVIAAIGGENPALGPDTLALQCQRRQLKSVSLCLDEHFEPSASACPLRSNCGDTVVVRPNRQMLGYSGR